MNGIRIIKYEEQYLEQVKEFLNEVAVKEFGFTDWRNYFYSGKFLQLNSERDGFWIAVDEENYVIGTIGLTEDENFHTAKLHSLYVKKELRQNGIARELYRICEQFAKEKEYDMIILHTYLEFSEAIKFYRRRGYKINQDAESRDGIWYYKKIKDIEEQLIWKDYFANLRNKYSMRVSSTKPLVINLDGKDITKGGWFSLVDNMSENGFLNIMEQTVKFFSQKYHCLAIFGTDEVSFILKNPMILVNDINTKSNKKSDEIISMFSQYFFEYFNRLNDKEKVYWHGECFSIPEGKVNSYIRYKSGSIKNVLTTYFLKKNGVVDAGKIKLLDKMEECKKYEYYESNLKELLDGILYDDGDRIDITEFLNGNRKKIEVQPKIKSDIYIDLSSWNEE